MMFCIMILFWGCLPPPNVKPFADQTVNMSSVIGKGYTQIETLLSQADQEQGQEKKLSEAWDGTKKTLNAVVEYSDAIVSLADAGNNGSDAVESVATSLQALADTVGTVLPASGVVDAVTEVTKIVYAQIARIRTKKALKDAVEAAQPAVEKIAELIKQNLDNLNTINLQAGEKLEVDLQDSHKNVVEYYEALIERDNNIVRELTSITINENLRYLKDLRADSEVMLSGIDLTTSTADTLAQKIEQRRKFLLEESKDIKKEASRYQSEYETYLKKRLEIKALARSGSILIKRSKVAIDTWAKTHAKLKRTLEKKQSFNVREFAAVVQDIYEAYEAYKDGSK